ncbi:hypothetical protein HO133_010719 [Letharia lupina]|uniref:Uncharacterized protein n=1 Tax=Letharia lupina TaxID=560253 RepID=A0A8H6CID4_9LECA|nr:uncharacterized protein HO133_010719 [Letharia lupina]KAF6224145.1 hypothetical protein HO133_010719 [Letharia lupina]
MSGDQGEMFFPEYWQFEAEINSESKLALDRRRPIPRSLGPLEDEPTFKDWVNASLPQPLQAPFSLHTSHQLNSRPLFSRLLRSPRDIFALDTRAFACPGGVVGTTLTSTIEPTVTESPASSSISSTSSSSTTPDLIPAGGATGTAKVAKDNGAERADVRSWVAIGLLGLVALIVS